jgi:hypothetical protein
MKLRNLKSINEASERDMLNYIIASQLTILRRIDLLEDKLFDNKSDNDNQSKSYLETTKLMIKKNDTSFNKINEYLKMDALDKGEFKI